MFPTEPLAYTVFTHDVVLKTILDEGYLWLLILVVLVWRTFVLLRGTSVDPSRRPPGWSRCCW